MSANSNLALALVEALGVFEPPPDISISQWAINNRIMPRGTTARPGPFRPEVYQIEMMDIILRIDVHEIVVLKSTQIGYSDAVLNNIVGYFIDLNPQPMMFVQPTIESAQDYGKKRITPMLEACPVLRDKVRPTKSRAPGNTLSLKEFPGGFLKLTGANAGTGLRSDPCPIILWDEIDAYPLDVGGEGDPISIGSRRTDSFPNWKMIKGSTPAKPTGVSPIERAYLASDQRKFHVPCPFCGHTQPLLWRDPETKEYRLAYATDAAGFILPESVGYICAQCKKLIPEKFKQQMLNAGKWVAKFPGRPVVGFHINALYSPWQENWQRLATEWLEANRDKNPEKIKAFVNLRLGETWEENADGVERDSLVARREAYKAEVPTGVGLLTASVDVQSDRLECVVKGWGAGEESWLIAYMQFFGDPGQSQVWAELDEFLLTRFKHESGQLVGIASAMVDSGGVHTDETYRFCAARMNRRIFPLKGSSEPGKEVLHKSSINNSYRVKLWSIGTDTAKDRIFARMKIPAPAAGFMHLPDWVESEYLEQLTAEKTVRRYKKNRGIVREYVKTRARNEALDLEVYALAALYIFGVQVIRQLGEMAARLAEVDPQEPPPTTGGRAVRHPGIA